MRIKETYFWKQKFKLIGIILFAVILSRIDFTDLLKSITNTKLLIYFLSFLFSIPAIFLRSFRWKLFSTDRQSIDLKNLSAFRFYWIAVFWGAITPGKIGEMFKIKYLREEGLGWGEAAAATIIDRLVDLICLVILFYLGILFISGIFISQLPAITLLILVAIAAVIISFFIRRNLYKVLQKIIYRLFRNSNADQIEKAVIDFNASVKSYRIRTWVLSAMLTIIAWIIFAIQRYFIAMALGLHIDVFDYCIIMFVVAFVTLIPVSVEGIGTRDAILIYLLGFYGVSPGEAVALSMLILGLMLFNTMLGAFLYFGSIKKNQIHV